jgi:TPR repeat protein
MKANRLAFVILFLFGAICIHADLLDRIASELYPQGQTNNLGVAAAQQTNSASSVTNNEPIAELKAKAEKGDAIAEYYLGVCYRDGQGVAKDQVEEVKWYRRAAEQGNAMAQYNLGVCYHDGEGVAKDQVEAAKWIRKAAEQGNDAAQYNLGWCYRDGYGVAQDYAETVKWWHKAAEQGNMIAQYNLGCCYRDGQGVAQDYVEAAKWYRRAADQGSMSAQSVLGAFYADGTGVPKNNVQAYMWWNLASAHSANNESDKTSIEKIASQRDLMVKVGEITPEEVVEAQRLSAAFVPRKETPSSSFDNPASSDSPKFSGTGFFITDDGYLISNNHVVKDATKVRLLTSAGLISAKVVKVDAANDLALLKAEGRFAPLPISPSWTAHLGSTVATVGFPNIGLQGFAPKLTKGEISSLSGIQDDPRYFQISLPVQPGNSGGALVDEHGNVVGIVAAKLSARAALDATGSLPENVNYAVKSSLLLSFLESVPDVSAKLKAPITVDRKFEDVVKSAQDAAVLVLVY